MQFPFTADSCTRKGPRRGPFKKKMFMKNLLPREHHRRTQWVRQVYDAVLLCSLFCVYMLPTRNDYV